MYLAHLLNTAYGIPSVFTGSYSIDDSTEFFTLFLQSLDPKQVTRNGLDDALDILFKHEDMLDFILSLENQQNIICPPSMQKYWDFIIITAWNQHVALQKVIRESA